MPWAFEVFDERFVEKQLTLDDYVELEDRMSTKDDPVSWRQIHPLNSARCAKYVAAHMYAQRSGMTFNDAFAKVGALGAVEFIDAIELVADDEEPLDPPKAGES